MSTPGYVFRDGGAIPDDELDEAAKQQGSQLPGEAHASNLHQGQQQDKSIAQGASSPDRLSNHQTKLSSLAGETTDSHALAAADHEEKGAAQEEHFETEVKDLGWGDNKAGKPLVGGIENEELWMLVRRFDKVSGAFRGSCLRKRGNEV